MISKNTACVAFVFLAAAGCSKPPRDAFGNNLNCKKNGELTQTETATWYGNSFHGRRTASGETFDTSLPTAAHNTLPFGTEVMVVNLNNNQAVRVVVNDRGRFQKSAIDLSEGAMDAIGGIESGSVRVEVYKCDHREMRPPTYE